MFLSAAPSYRMDGARHVVIVSAVPLAAYILNLVFTLKLLKMKGISIGRKLRSNRDSHIRLSCSDFGYVYVKFNRWCLTSQEMTFQLAVVRLAKNYRLHIALRYGCSAPLSFITYVPVDKMDEYCESWNFPKYIVYG